MLIKESTLRRIIREEAQRVLREVAGESPPITREEMRAASAQNDEIRQYMNYDPKVRAAIRRAVDVVQGYNPTAAGVIFSNYEKFFMTGLMSPFNEIMSEIVALGDSVGPDAKARMVIAAFANFPQDRSLTSKAFLPTDEYLGLTGATSGTARQVALNRAIGDSKTFLEGVSTMASYDIAAMVRKTLSPPAATGPAAPAAPAVPAAPAAPAKVKDWQSYIRLTPRGAEVKAAWEAYADSGMSKTDKTFFSFLHWWNKQMENKQYNKFDGSVEQTIAALKARTKAPVTALSSAPDMSQSLGSQLASRVGALKR